MDFTHADGARTAVGTSGRAALPRGTLAPHHVSAVMAHVEMYLDTPLCVRGLAAVANLSPFHFARMFKAAVGVAPHAYVTNARIERARRLLSTSDLPLRDIARSAGYLTQAHFTSVFRRQVGTTPRVFRETSRNAAPERESTAPRHGM